MEGEQSFLECSGGSSKPSCITDVPREGQRSLRAEPGLCTARHWVLSLLLPATLGSGFCFYPHFTDVETEVSASQWQSCYPQPGLSSSIACALYPAPSTDTV